MQSALVVLVSAAFFGVAWKQNTLVNCFREAGLIATAEDVCLATQDDDSVSCLDSALRELSVFSGVVPHNVTADDYGGVDDAVESVADRTDVDTVADNAGVGETDSTDEDEEAQLSPTDAELISPFGVIRRCRAAMEGSGLTDVENLDNIETSVLNFKHEAG